MLRALKSIIFPGLLSAIVASGALAQVPERIARNNPYAPSPASKQKVVAPQAKPLGIEVVALAQPPPAAAAPERSIVIEKSIERRDPAPRPKLPATSVYTVGIGDVFVVEMRNGVTSTTTCTVRSDGTIDFPLAGGPVSVSGQSIQEVRETLTGSIKLYARPQINVRLIGSASHAVLVTGVVSIPGIHEIQRDAVPLYVIRAAAIVEPTANVVSIKRSAGDKEESYALDSPQTADILINPGDEIKFSRTDVKPFYYIGGAISEKKDLASGLRLTMAVAGLGNGKAKKAVIRRREADGSVKALEHDLKAIKAGKSLDPPIAQGDIIEILK